ncbi:ABC transporter substrate-binding protein [archaeon]|nr:ABC transporter substrate-binding protein [archaeon]
MQSPWINDAEFIGYFVAMEKGFYKDEGIEFKYLPGGPEIVADSVLLVKRAEIALTTPDVTINAILKQEAPFKIIGAQYQKNPLGIVSLEKNNIRKPQDLVGKTLAAPPANHLTVDAFLKINNISKNDVRVVPYQYDPTPLLNGEVDATLDFVTNVPFTIKERGGKPTSFLLYDYGFQIFNDTVVVRQETLETHREILAAWLRASRRGWIENFRKPSIYPAKFADSYFKGTGRSIENEVFFNRAQQPLIESKLGIFSMAEAAIAANIRSLEAVGIKATREMFETDLI